MATARTDRASSSFEHVVRAGSGRGEGVVVAVVDDGGQCLDHGLVVGVATQDRATTGAS
jgi:hypothetical protein